jgi:hypothetical protein
MLTCLRWRLPCATWEPYAQLVVTAGGALYAQGTRHADEVYEDRMAVNFGAEWAAAVGAHADPLSRGWIVFEQDKRGRRFS